MPTYNKLIRNKIPQIIKANGKTPTTRILPKDEYIKELYKKTKEELTEYIEAKNKTSQTRRSIRPTRTNKHPSQTQMHSTKRNQQNP